MKFKLLLGVFLVMALFALQAAASDLDIVSISAASGEPGEAVEVSVTVQNLGTDPIQAVKVTSTVLANNGKTISVPEITDIVDLQTEQVKTFLVTLPSVPAGDYLGELEVTDRANSDNTAKETYTVTVEPVADFSLSTTSLKITGQADSAARGHFTLTNKGSTVLSFTMEAEGDFKDDDYDSIGVSFSSLEPLAPGASVVVAVTADVDRMVDIGLYSGKIKVKASSNGFIEEKELGLAVEVQPKMCEYGVTGDLEVTIEEPDDGEEFSPGDLMLIDVKVNNRYSKDMDVVVEAVLYDATENEEIASVKSDDEEVDDGRSESFDLELEIPTSDLDEDNDYYLYAKAYKRNDENEHCIFDRIKLNINRGDDNVIIEKFEIEPSASSCGNKVVAEVEVENIGTDDQEDVYIVIKSKDLQLELESDKFDLDEYDDIDSKHRERFEFTLPGDIDAGEYFIGASVYFGSEYVTEHVSITLNECKMKSLTEAKIVLSPVEEKITVKPGVREFVLPFVVENVGGKPASVRVDVTEASGWADQIGAEVPELLNAYEKYHGYIYMELKGDVAEGPHSLRINVKNEEGVLQSKMLTVDVLGDSSSMTVGRAVEDLTRLDGFFKDKSKLYWLIGDALLVIIALVFIRMLLKRT